MFGEYGSGTVHGDDRDIRELLAAIEAAFVARTEDEQTDSDDKLLGLLKQLVHEHPEGFYLMHGEKLAFSHHGLIEVRRRPGYAPLVRLVPRRTSAADNA